MNIRNIVYLGLTVVLILSSTVACSRGADPGVSSPPHLKIFGNAAIGPDFTLGDGMDKAFLNGLRAPDPRAIGGGIFLSTALETAGEPQMFSSTAELLELYQNR